MKRLAVVLAYCLRAVNGTPFGEALLCVLTAALGSALLVAGVALAADPPYATVSTATSNAACAALPKGQRIAVQCTTDSFVTIAAANSTTALTALTATKLLTDAFYDTSASEQYFWGCATAASSAGTCTFMVVGK